MLTFTIGNIAYAYVVNHASILPLNKRFYFLVADSTHVETSAHFAVLSGGAGYLLEYNDNCYATISVYLTKMEGEKAAKSLKSQGTKLVEVSAEAVYLKTKKEKSAAKYLQGAFDCLYACIKILNGEIVRLDNGATQESGERILRELEKQFSYLQEEYKKIFPLFSRLCDTAVKSLEIMRSDIIYVRDLRYLQCELCNGYRKLSQEFCV